MGICQSANSKNSYKNSNGQQPTINNTSGSTKEIYRRKGDDKDSFAQAPNQQKINADVKVAINPDVYISKSESNPETIYKKERILGEGAFGEVWLVKNKELKKQFAMKIIKKRTQKPSEEKEIVNEIKILKNLDHPKILKILDFYPTSSQYYIITEYCPLGELFNEIQAVGSFDEGQASFIMNQIFRAVAYCHGMNVIHRDLKPENIMISKRESNKCLQIKIIDFGTAKTFEKGQSENRFVGSSYYIAPEVIQRKYTEKCDLWSCGVIMYILLTGRPPFDGRDDNEIMRNVRTGVYDNSSNFFTSLSNEAKDLIQKLLELDPKKRISAIDALSHKWFKSSKFKEKDKINIISPSMARQLLSNMKKYHSDNLLRCAVIAYLVHHNTNIEQCNEASKLFNKIDVNGDGKIERHELLDGVTTYWKLPKEQVNSEVDQIFNNIDTDHNGYIEYEEFVRAAVDQKFFLQKNYLKFAFNYFDTDNSGEISLSEVTKRFKQNTKNANDPKIDIQIKKSFESIDVNGDGNISFEEFCQMMENIITEKY